MYYYIAAFNNHDPSFEAATIIGLYLSMDLAIKYTLQRIKFMCNKDILKEYKNDRYIICNLNHYQYYNDKYGCYTITKHVITKE